MNWHYKLFFANLLFIFFTYAIDEEKDYSPCWAIKKIDEDAPKSTYLSLLKKLKKNNLTVRECTEYLVEERQKRAIQLLENNGLVSQETCDNLNELRQDVKDSDLDPTVPLYIHFPERSDFSEEIRQEVIETFASQQQVIPLHGPEESELTAAGSAAGTLSIHETLGSVKSNGINFYKPMTKSYHLFIAKDFQNFSQEARTGILLHEKQHMLSNHDVVDQALENAIMLRYNLDESWDCDIEDAIIEGHLKIKRSLEAEADRIPACADSRAAYALFKLMIAQMKSKYNNKKGDHPPDVKRYIWAKRLYRLKKLEEEVNFHERLAPYRIFKKK